VNITPAPASSYSFLSLAVFALAGCTVGPNYTPPAQPELPQSWSATEVTLPVNEEALENWWTTFGDPNLTRLIERADACNLDVTAALARIDESRALRDFAAGENLPNVDLTARYSRSRFSQSSLLGAPGESDQYAAGFDAFWEIDLFGRIRRSVESAKATLEQSVDDYRDISISLYAEVARNYIDLRTAQARIRYAQANIDIQRKTLELTQNRVAAEIAPKLDVAQARLNLANTESEIPSLRISENVAVNRLAVLLGTTTRTVLDEIGAPAEIPRVQAPATFGVPAELLRRRPDIRSAERALAAQTARIGVAEAQRYPDFTLSGIFELQGMQFTDLGDWSSRAYTINPVMRWTIFSGNRLLSLVHVEEARTRQVAAAYEQTVLRAVADVEDAMVGYAQESLRIDALRRSVDAAREAVDMVDKLYRSGLTDFQNVLDSQRSLSVQQDRLAVSEGLYLQQVINLYKALGGGWPYSQEVASQDGDLSSNGMDAADAMKERSESL
jgi:multidrug efflux system outer membrane protein